MFSKWKNHFAAWAAFATIPAFPAFADLPHLELEMTSEQYQALLERRRASPELQPVIHLGKRNLDWLNTINRSRPEAKRLSFSSPSTQGGYPIESPKESNPALILQAYQRLRDTLPMEMKLVLLEESPLTQELPLPESEYLHWGLKVDGLYQSAARWIVQEPYLSAYARRASGDIRGYYALTREDGLEDKLLKWPELSSSTQEKYKNWLIGLCLNSGSSRPSCTSMLEQAIQDGSVFRFYETRLESGKKKWDGYFKIAYRRNDVTWGPANPDLMTVPFLTPDRKDVEDFLRVNIEDEWRLGEWRLGLVFGEGSVLTTPHIVFVPGATPNVSGPAGNRITMDANQPLTEYNVQWTIRHEFGHVLGLPDCYVEFYDTEKQVMVSYQLDLTNLMCSRRGKIQEKHVSELQRVYFH